MGEIHQVTATWTGFIGGPGYTNLYFKGPDAGTANEDVYAWLFSARTVMPDDVTISVAGSGSIIEDTTGELVDTWTNGSTATFNGSSTGAYSAPSGICVTWRTGGIVEGRRVRGRTFLVPMGADTYQTNGTLDDTVLTSFRTNALMTALLGDNGLCVWSRPRGGGAVAGSSHLVTSWTVSDKIAVLRSRRD